jgi:phosphoesterase RecJ-like protein
MPKSLISEYGADNSATEGMSNAVMSCEGVEAGIFVKYDEEEVVFSLRSSGKIDVGKIAESFEVGGGHKFAAGCTLKGISAKEATRIVLDKISQQLFALD